MGTIFKRGASQILLVILLLILSTILVLPTRRYLYLAYQNLSLKIGVNLNNIATNDYVNWIKSQSQQYQSAAKSIFLNKPVSPYPLASNEATVLGESSKDDRKWIEIDLSEQRLYMREDGQTVGSFLVSTGKWAPTPAGQWRIWTKLRYTRMEGGSKALGTYYNLPNVPYVMYYDRGYGVHGAYWHNNFGQPMSHGCVNMKPEEAGIVFNWSNVGTRVVVHN